HRQPLRRLPVEPTVPTGPPVIHRDQPRPYPYPVPVSLNVPLQYRVDPQLAASGYRISLEPRKLAHRISRSYDDSIDAAEIRNQGVGHAQLEVFVANLGAYRQKGQHRDRLRLTSRWIAHWPCFPEVQCRSGRYYDSPEDEPQI